MPRLVLLLLLALPCSAQICTFDEQAKPENPYAYMRTQVKALKLMRQAIELAATAQWPGLPDEPDYLHKAVAYYETIDGVDEKYTCAQRLLERYKQSKNDTVKESADSLLTAIDATKQINSELRAMVEAINKAKKIEDLHQEETAKHIADITSRWKVIHEVAMMGVKMSTYGIVHGEGGDDNWKPVAFTITRQQHKTLLADVQALAEGKSKEMNYVDLCADLLLKTLNQLLPMADSPSLVPWLRIEPRLPCS
jgi:hypothetical protein